MKSEHAPIIVIKKKKGHGRHDSHGSWKIAYADFMTAMMAFFMVMWLISISDPQKLESIAEYFRMPLKVAINGGPRSSDSHSVIPGGGQDITQVDGEVKQADSKKDRQNQKEKQSLKRLQNKLETLLLKDPRLKALRPHLLITLGTQGLRIQIIDSKQRPMFQRGSARVEPYMAEILHAIAPILNDVPNKISIAGHTDDYQYQQGDRGYSNWELSADRANASRRELMFGGLLEGKIIRVIGMADTMHLHDHDADDAENRRISLLVLTHQAEQAIEEENRESQALTITDAGELKDWQQSSDVNNKVQATETATQAVIPSSEKTDK